MNDPDDDNASEREAWDDSLTDSYMEGVERAEREADEAERDALKEEITDALLAGYKASERDE